MRPERLRRGEFAPRQSIEAGAGDVLFELEEEEDPKGWLWAWQVEGLGALCAEAWHDDLLEEDSAWAAAHREKFKPWTQGLLSDAINAEGHPGKAPSTQRSFDELRVLGWAALLEAVRSALLAAFEEEAKERAAQGEPVDWDPAARAQDSHVLRTLTAEGAAEALGPRLLCAFRRGVRVTRRGCSKMMTRPVPRPEVWHHFIAPETLKRIPGPRAARQLALQTEVRKQPTVNNWREVSRELRDLYAAVWRDDLPPEDQQWAWAHRKVRERDLNGLQRHFASQGAIKGYLASSGGLFYGHAGPLPDKISFYLTNPWDCFAERVVDAPEGEGELETAEAGAREYWDARYEEPPPWEGDPNQIHWLAAARAAREADLIYDRRYVLILSAAKAYSASSGGRFYNSQWMRPEEWTSGGLHPWWFFVARVEGAPEGESELETAEAAARDYWVAGERKAEPPPWESDPNQVHWLAALRAVREAAVTYGPPQA